MADIEQSQTAVPSAPAPVVVTETAPSVAPVETPVVEPSVPTPEAPASEPVVTEPVKTESVTSVLGDDGKTDIKPDTTKTDPVPEAKPVEVVAPVYEFKLPENVSVDKEPLDSFTKLLGEIETGKLDHAAFQDKGQALVDMHVKNLNDSINRLNDYYVQIHEKQKNDWFQSFKNDPDLGGDKVNSTVKSVRDAIDTFGGSPEQISDLRTEMKNSGYGNHPSLIRLINNMQQKIDSYTKENTSDKRMVPAARPAPSKVKPYQAFYRGAKS